MGENRRPQRTPDYIYPAVIPPCAERAQFDQSTPAGMPYPAQKMCFNCGRVTARVDEVGLPWCGGRPVSADTPAFVPTPTGKCTAGEPLCSQPGRPYLSGIRCDTHRPGAGQENSRG